MNVIELNKALNEIIDTNYGADQCHESTMRIAAEALTNVLEIDKIYSEKCREVAELRAELKAFKDTVMPREDNTKLKPCPFCGSHDVDVVIYSDDGTLETAGEDEAPAFVHCWGCDMDYFPNTDIQGKVMEAWNRRGKSE